MPDFQGAAAQLALRYSLRSATSFTVTVDRDVQYSYELTQPYFVSTDVGIAIRRQLVGSFDTTLSAQRFHYAYQDVLAPQEVVLPQRIDITHNYGGDVGYRLSRMLVVSVSAFRTGLANRIE